MAKHIALIIALSVAGCTEQRTSIVTDDSQVDDIHADDSGERKSDGGQPDTSYSYQYCDGRQVLTGVCSEGICDPAPFETCDDGSCVLLPGSCNKKSPPPLPEMDVTIKNERAESIFIDGLFVPFTLRDSDGEEIATHRSLNISSCDGCNDICDSNIHGDPAPCYIEIAAGAEVTVSWDAMTYWNETCVPICDKSCSKSAPLEPGDYTIVIPYRLKLDDVGYDFTEAATCWASVQGGTGWRGNGIGTCMFSHEAELVVSYSEQDELLLSIN